MNYIEQTRFKDEEIKFQFKTDSELYVVTKDILYTLYIFDSKHKNGRKVAQNRLGSEVIKYIP